jgi:DNA-binding transcriptional ArsR family regulator
MTKVTLDMNTFKALASNTRLDILKALDGKKLNLKDISKITNLNKATLHEHLVKLNEAGLVKKKEREGHKWVYYKLTWKGEGLLHPENTRIVVLFTTSLLTLFLGIVMLVNYVKGYIVGKAVNYIGSDSTLIYEAETDGLNIIPQATQQFSPAPIANVPLQNQTINTLSKSFLDSAEFKGIVGNNIDTNNIAWKKMGESYSIKDFGGELLTDKGSGIVEDRANDAFANIPSEMVAVVHDPALQYIAVGCVIIFTILLSIGIWRIYKNKKPKF